MSTCISKRGEFGSHEFVRSGDTVICEDCGYLTYAAPEPRSTPGPSTGTPEPSQAASEAHSGEVARLREALEQVRALADLMRTIDHDYHAGTPPQRPTNAVTAISVAARLDAILSRVSR